MLQLFLFIGIGTAFRTDRRYINCMRMANELKLANANRRRATIAEPVVPLADSATELSSGAGR